MKLKYQQRMEKYHRSPILSHTALQLEQNKSYPCKFKKPLIDNIQWPSLVHIRKNSLKQFMKFNLSILSLDTIIKAKPSCSNLSSLKDLSCHLKS